METEILQIGDKLPGKFKQIRIHNIAELEAGTYWPQLQPHFMGPYFRHLTYRLVGKSWRNRADDDTLSVRGASGFGNLDIAYVADRYATELSISETGLPHYCITSVNRGALEYQEPNVVEPIVSDEKVGLVYRGLPETRLRSADDNERLALWIPAQSLDQRLAALLGEPGKEVLSFAPTIYWNSASGQSVRRLWWLLIQELRSPYSYALSGVAGRSFEDLLLYSVLQSLEHNYTERLGRTAPAPVPRIIRRAEEFIRSRAGQPIALHELADVAGCSVRSLQLGFRQFRSTTPAAAIRQARLEAVRQVLTGSEPEATVTDIAHRFGFTNPGRFTQLYRAAFGVSPASALR